MIPTLLFMVFLLKVCQGAKCYLPNTIADFSGPLYPLETNGLSGHFSGFWSNYTANYSELSFQVWLLSYHSATTTPRSYVLSLVAIRNPRKLWDLVNPLVIWSANRNNPVQVEGNSITLEFGSDGNLSLNENGLPVWSTNTSNKGVHELCITDNASILLLHRNQSKIWISSDQPTDTLLFTRALEPGSELVSWISEVNSSSGPYKLVMERNGLALLYNSEPYWVFSFSGENNTDSLLATSSKPVYSVFCWYADDSTSFELRTNFSQFRSDNKLMYTCGDPNPDDRRIRLPVSYTNLSRAYYATFIKLSPNGDLVIYSWDNVWRALFNFSSLFGNCFLPSKCGAYQLCEKATGKCQTACPETFHLKDGICSPQVALDTSACTTQQKPVKFVKIAQGVDYFFTNYTNSKTLAEEECISDCKSNCSCKAVFHKESTCFQTHEDVQTLQTGDYIAFLKVGDETKKKKKKFLTISLAILLPVLALLLGCLLWHLMQWKGDRFLDEEGEELELSLHNAMPRRFTYEELEIVTNNFSDCLGNGGFGSVFKGVLNQAHIAVKKLEGSNQRSRDFYAEVAILAKTHHWNLVKLLGYCAEGPRKRLLVYEYMEHGSLEKWIFNDNEKPESSLTWEVRYNIAIGTARGLSYLHEQCDEKIIHLDLKPENVLLDSSFQPKIADFGLSKLMDRKESYLQMTTMRGTPGYVAPECLQEGTITEKSDVFSFGVLLLEIISGRRNKSLSADYLGYYLHPREQSVYLIEEEEEGVQRLMGIAFLCVQDDPDMRPVMSKVIQMMEGVVEVPSVPSRTQLHFFLSYRSRFRTPVNSTSSNTVDTSESSAARLFTSSSAPMISFPSV